MWQLSPSAHSCYIISNSHSSSRLKGGTGLLALRITMEWVPGPKVCALHQKYTWIFFPPHPPPQKKRKKVREMIFFHQKNYIRPYRGRYISPTYKEDCSVIVLWCSSKSFMIQSLYSRRCVSLRVSILLIHFTCRKWGYSHFRINCSIISNTLFHLKNKTAKILRPKISLVLYSNASINFSVQCPEINCNSLKFYPITPIFTEIREDTDVRDTYNIRVIFTHFVSYKKICISKLSLIFNFSQI